MIATGGLGCVLRFRKLFRLFAVLACGSLAACVQTTALKSTNATFDWSSPQKRVLLIAPDVELAEVTAGGLREPRADWSDHAAHAIEASIGQALAQRGIEVSTLETLNDPHDVQLAKLHSVVGMEILFHHMGLSKLPTKTSPLDWTLGPGTNDLRGRHGADYGMFVFVRDSYSSGTRKAMMMLGMANGGMQGAFVSLVDLRTGNIVWFNQLFTEGGGDLRDGSGAPAFTADLLKGAPI
jgi:hypothetical protein